MPSFIRTSEDGSTHNRDTCCGDSVFRTSGDDIPSPEKDGGVVYVYSRCRKCNALWRDGFRDGYHTEHNTPSDSPFLPEAMGWEFDYIDTNKLHNDIAIAVYKPVEEDWNDLKEELIGYPEFTKKEIEEYNIDEHEKRKRYVFRFCEVDKTSVSPIMIGSVYRHTDKDEYFIEITDITFTDDGEIEEFEAEVSVPGNETRNMTKFINEKTFSREDFNEFEEQYKRNRRSNNTIKINRRTSLPTN